MITIKITLERLLHHWHDISAANTFKRHSWCEACCSKISAWTQKCFSLAELMQVMAQWSFRDESETVNTSAFLFSTQGLTSQLTTLLHTFYNETFKNIWFKAVANLLNKNNIDLSLYILFLCYSLYLYLCKYTRYGWSEVASWCKLMYLDSKVIHRHMGQYINCLEIELPLTNCC